MSGKTSSSGRTNNFRSRNKERNNCKNGPSNRHELAKNCDTSSVKEGTCRGTGTRNNSNNRPQFRRLDSSQLNSQKPSNKRRFTISGWHDIKCLRKRRRVNSVALPTKFLLGGNINDPLNLKSLEDEEVNRKLNAATPASSPVPLSRHRTQVQILIPTNIYDPLNLNTGEEIEFNIISPRTRKRKRHRRGNRKEEVSTKNEVESNDKCANLQDHVEAPLKEEDKKSEVTAVCQIEPIKDETTVDEAAKPAESNDDKAKEKPKASHGEKNKNHCEKIKICQSEKCSEEKSKLDKIVSPVVPQGSKFYKRLYSSASSSSKTDRRRRCSKKKKNCYSEAQFKPENSRFCYGSNPLHYHCNKAQDVRFKFFTKALFSGKDVLDIGCNVGCMSSLISEFYEPRKVVGIDIDPRAISTAQRHILQHVNSSVNRREKFPSALAFNFGPLYRLSLAMDKSDPTKFPHNLTFIQGNYALNSDEELQMEQPEYDTILCLRATKWIHLNFGDEGLKRAFKRMFAQLRYGGQLVLEPQPWAAYSRTRNLTESIYNTYNRIELKPEKFVEYLLSKEVGFSSCKVIGRITNRCRGYRQSLYILTKVASFSPAPEVTQSEVVSPVVFNDIEWAHSCEDEQDSSCEWESSALCGSPLPADFVSPPEDTENPHYDLYTEGETFLDDSYFFPPDYDSIQDLYE